VRAAARPQPAALGAALGLLAGTDLVLTVARRSLEGARLDPALRQFLPPLAIAPFTFCQAWHASRGGCGHCWLRRQLQTLCTAPALAEC
jgi:hypothetical protein